MMKNILVVDDDKTNLIAAKNALGDQYRVIPVTSGVQALKYLESHTCDLILLDIKMPDMDGFEVMEKIKADSRLSDIPVVFLTADNGSETEIRGLGTGAFDFISKPFIPAVMVSRIENILDKVEEVNNIKNISNQDTFTGLWNRKYTEERISETLKNGSHGALFMIDLDNFKEINDLYGHSVGDNVISLFADTMRKFAEDDYILGRIGGDEFIIYAEGKTVKEELSKLATDIIYHMDASIEEKKYDTNFSVSIGIAMAPDDGESFNELYNAADKALYHVKQNGKNSFHFYGEQNSEERERGKRLVDLKYLHSVMGRDDSGKGVYQLDLANFHHVYNFIRRFVERSGQDVQTILFTALCDPDVPQEEINEALELLDSAIFKSLRRADVSTRYSSRQIIVILMDASTDNGDTVARRIIECFENTYSGGKVSLSFDVAKIEGSRTYDGDDDGDGTQKTILVVDDDTTNLISAKNALGNAYRTVAVPSGAQALKYLETGSCDLVLLDINMPEMDGFEVLKRIRQDRRFEQIPVIFLTADNDSETENRCLEVGAIDYIIKPFVVNVLRSRISRTLELEDFRKSLEQKVYEKTEQIRHIQDMTVLGMAIMVESRDNSTGGHIKRTGDAVNVFAQYLYNIGYISDTDYLKKIIRAAPMHDLGKISIDDRVLRKNGKFTDEEYTEMKRHSAEGAKVIEKMLRGVDDDTFVDIAINVAKYHHERWDGKGYPEGKAGEDIPTEARIMALADVFDALVSKRCYKEAFTYDKAFSIIEESLGTQFDPTLGKHFMECRKELEEMYNAYE